MADGAEGAGIAGGVVRLWGRVQQADGARVVVGGLGRMARIGDGLEIGAGRGAVPAEVIAVAGRETVAMLTGDAAGIASGQRAYLAPRPDPCPSDGWLGHAVDAFGRCLAGGALPDGRPRPLAAPPPPGALRRGLGPRIATGFAALDTLLPLCRGQRMGIFAGSGVGKSMLLTGLAQSLAADVTVVGLVGERGRELGETVRRLLSGPAAERTVVVAATSDAPAPVKRRAGQMALAVAEHFRDSGRHVLLLFDSVTRYAEAHREIALAAGEPPALRAFPASTAAAIAALCERAGPGADGAAHVQGDITALFTVLVAGSDLDEPVADMLRGVLDGHIVLDRTIAERGRFPAIDLARSVSRSAPEAWTAEEAALAAEARRLLADYEEAAPMIRAGLYASGADPALDRAIRLHPALDRFLSERLGDAPRLRAFRRLAEILADPVAPPGR